MTRQAISGQSSGLKGMCHEMNNILEILKVKEVLYVYATLVF
jgi:hypothetical protein